MNEDFLEALENASDSLEDGCYIYIGDLQFSYMGNHLWTILNNFGGQRIINENVTREELISYIPELNEHETL